MISWNDQQTSKIIHVPDILPKVHHNSAKWVLVSHEKTSLNRLNDSLIITQLVSWDLKPVPADPTICIPFTITSQNSEASGKS